MNLKTNENQHVLVTGTAGFIGYHFTKKLVEKNLRISAIDNLSPYYDTNLKYSRLLDLGFSETEIDNSSYSNPAVSSIYPNLEFFRVDLKDTLAVSTIFESQKPTIVVHLAAQAGVRYSLENPAAYIDSNITGFMNILENCRNQSIKHLVFSSSSSVYGANRNMPYSEHQNVDHPISLYAATKKSNELMAHSYSHLFRLPVTGLRFFTVYGPWGRPDMAYFNFTEKICKNLPIDVFNHGNMKRDFTYIDDVTEGIFQIMQIIPKPDNEWDEFHPDPASSNAPYRIFNIGNHNPVNLLYFIEQLEKYLGKKAIKNFLPLQQGDVLETYANIDSIRQYTGFVPRVSIEDGLARFVEWYVKYYKVDN